MKKLALVAALAASSQVNAAGIDASLSDDSAYFKYLFDSTNIVQGGADIAVGIFYNDKEENGVDADAVVGTAQFTVTGNMKGTKQRIKLSAGAKAYAGTTDIDDTDIGAIAIGGRAAYIIPSQNTPMATYVEGFVAPGITSFGDTDRLYEVGVGFEAELAPSAKGYIGYRLIETDFENGADDVELDDSLHVGLQFTF